MPLCGSHRVIVMVHRVITRGHKVIVNAMQSHIKGSHFESPIESYQSTHSIVRIYKIIVNLT